MATTANNVEPVQNLRAALKYARAGYPIVMVYPLRDVKGGRVCTCSKGTACKTPGKHAILNAWQKVATTDEDKIRQWFKRYPNAHVGVMPPKDCVIIDIDPRNGGDETWAELVSGRKYQTPTQRSGGGGTHYVFKGEVHNKLGKGIDIKRHGRGYVVAWPSAHESGGSYRWTKAPWDVDAAPVPKALREEKEGVEQAPSDGTKRVKTNIELATVRAALAHVDADDYHRWINVGQALKHNYGRRGEEIWVEWSRTSSKYNPGDEEKWRTFDRNRDRPLITVRSIISIARRNGFRPSADEFAESLWIEGDIRHFLTEEAPAIDWVFSPCIPKGKVTVLSGAGGSSKSFMVLTLAIHLTLGKPFGPFAPASAGKALLLMAEEQKEDIHRRLRVVLNELMLDDEEIKTIGDRLGVVSTRGYDWRLVELDNAGNVQETDRVDYLIEQINALAGDIRLLVIDPLVAFNGVSENDNVQMARLMFILDRIAASTQCAVVVLHHMSKMGQVASLADVGQAIVRGASALVDNARSVMLMTRMPRTEAPMYSIPADDAGRFIVMRVAKNNYGPHVPDAIFAVGAGGTLRHAPEIVRAYQTPAAAARAQDTVDVLIKVAEALHAHPTASQRALAEAARCAQSNISRHLSELAERGWVQRVGIGNKGQYRLTRTGLAAIGRSIDDLIGE